MESSKQFPESTLEDMANMKNAMCKKSILPLAIAVLLVGCGDDPAGPVDGAMEGAVMDEPVAGSTYTGNVAGDFQFSVSEDGETWTDVGSVNGITLLLQDAASTSLHGSQEAVTGSFTKVRMLVRAVEVTVDAGSTIDGTTYSSDMKLDLAVSEDLLVVRDISSPTVESDEAVLVTFDLNSASWLTTDAVSAGVVTNAAVEAAVTASTAVVPR